MPPSTDVQCKLVLVGNGSVGKSSIIARFVDDGFHCVYRQTVGVDFFEKQVTVRNSLTLSLQVWDIGGQSLSSNMLAKYLYGSRVVFLCYDVTDPNSFSDLDDWLRIVRKHFGGSGAERSSDQQLKQVDIYLVANKIDLLDLRRVKEAQHWSFVSEHNLCGGMLCSAQSGQNVVRAFNHVAAQAAGVRLSEYELAFYDRVLDVTRHDEPAASKGGGGGAADSGRTAMADAIEAEDLALEAAKAAKRSCMCM
ncbi:P-loop containing nucleoside triphosphate hydrolase protein [Tribonema minus]|uniref:P-loop containing nucleoside triphosphate hydrolase protein n=1 Tax=Tribonema minus TaxID=303371 RepID=A0A835YQ54_9STRA|nr:P-loop containing nucleoside triphosphate hydrolase protein [Tribonema minus]